MPFHFFHFSEYPILNYFLLHGLMVIIVIMSFLQVLISVRRPLIVQIPPVSFQICSPDRGLNDFSDAVTLLNIQIYMYLESKVNVR